MLADKGVGLAVDDQSNSGVRRRKVRGGTQQLTPRQQEILRLVIDGLTNREIAERLGISVRTVEIHRFSLMKRLRARNVAQLLHEAYTRRLVEP